MSDFCGEKAAQKKRVEEFTLHVAEELSVRERHLTNKRHTGIAVIAIEKINE